MNLEGHLGLPNCVHALQEEDERESPSGHLAGNRALGLGDAVGLQPGRKTLIGKAPANEFSTDDSTGFVFPVQGVKTEAMPLYSVRVGSYTASLPRGLLRPSVGRSLHMLPAEPLALPNVNLEIVSAHFVLEKSFSTKFGRK